jgi:two-component system nitrogen regulation response regulator GlnG
MPFDLQTRLLRVLSDGHFYRVGGHSPVKANVRVIAATHQHLEQRVKDGSFREDLFHRLNVIRLRLPALRERKEDIAGLVQHFLQVSAKQLGAEPKRISAAALVRVSQFDFPGNVRQLENMCHWLTVMAPAQTIDVKDLPPEVLSGEAVAAPAVPLNAINSIALRADPITATGLISSENSASLGAESAAAKPPVSSIYRAPALASLADAGNWEGGLEAEALLLLAKQDGTTWDALTRRFESRLIQAALSTTRGRRIEAAVKLGIGRNTITRKIQELGLE